MKKNYSLLLVPVVVLILSLFSILGLQSVAAVKVDTSYAQSCTNDFINFIKTNNSFKAKDYFLFHEKAFAKGSPDFKTDYYYYPTGNFIQIKSVVTYKPNANTQEKRNVTFTIPGKYTGKTTIDYDYNDKQSNTLQAHSVINMTTYDGTNASFTKTGGGFSESQKDTNWWVNYAFIIADNMSYKNKRTDTGLYSFGF